MFHGAAGHKSRVLQTDVDVAGSSWSIALWYNVVEEFMRVTVNRVRVPTVRLRAFEEKFDLFYKALCALKTNKLGSTDAENVKRKENREL